MTHLTFWLHRNDKYMWGWHCYDRSGALIAISPCSFFALADAEQALQTARACIGQATLH